MSEERAEYLTDPPLEDKDSVLVCPGCGEFISFIVRYDQKYQLTMYPLVMYYIGGKCIKCGREIRWNERKGVNTT